MVFRSQKVSDDGSDERKVMTVPKNNSKSLAAVNIPVPKINNLYQQKHLHAIRQNQEKFEVDLYDDIPEVSSREDDQSNHSDS